MSSKFGFSILSPAAANKAGLIEHAEDDVFSRLIHEVELDPKNALQNSNLEGVDFSNSDLRHFNFRNARLTACQGTNCRFDNSTNFGGAEIRGSIFEHAVTTRELGKRHRGWLSEYRGLRDAHWTSVSSWAHTSSKARNQYLRERTWLICSKLLEQKAEGQTDLVLLALKVAPDKQALRAFLVHFISSAKLGNQARGTLVKSLLKQFPGDLYVAHALMSLLKSRSDHLRAIAIREIVGSVHFERFRPALAARMALETSSLNRRMYLAHLAMQLESRGATAACASILSFSRDEVVLDYFEVIGERYLALLASAHGSGKIGSINTNSVSSFLDEGDSARFCRLVAKGLRQFEEDSASSAIEGVFRGRLKSTLIKLSKGGAPLNIALDDYKILQPVAKISRSEASLLSWKKAVSEWERSVQTAATVEGRVLVRTKPSAPFRHDLIDVLTESIKLKYGESVT